MVPVGMIHALMSDLLHQTSEELVPGHEVRLTVDFHNGCCTWAHSHAHQPICGVTGCLLGRSCKATLAKHLVCFVKIPVGLLKRFLHGISTWRAEMFLLS
jgi:hypothetical protein